MSNYTKVTNFTAKDSLPSGNTGKVVRGSEIDTEFTNIQTAVNSKADIAGPTFTGTVTIPTVAISAGTITGITDLAIADGGTGASTAQNARNNLLPSQSTHAGKYLKTDGTDVSWDALDISTADITGTLPIANGGTGATTDSGARTALGLGSIATQAASNVAITGGAINGTTVGASTASTGAFTSLTSSSTTTLNGTTIPASKTLVVTTDIGSSVQAYDAQLADIAGLTPTDNNFIVGNGTNFVTESGSTARTSLGLGSIATQDANNVAITGGSINGTTVGGSTAAAGTFTSLTSNSTTTLNGTTIPASKTLVVTTDIGSSVQAYDSNLTSFVGTFTLPTVDGTNGQVLSTNGSGTLSFTTAGSGDVVGPASSTSNNIALFDGITGKLLKDGGKGLPSGAVVGTTDSQVLSNKTIHGNANTLTVDGTNGVGFLDIPPVGTKTGSYTLATGDVGKYVQVGSGGSITIPDATFAEGDVISIFNNTTGNITITCSITTAYIAGTDADKASVTLATRGLATVLFISSTVCVITGNVT